MLFMLFYVISHLFRITIIINTVSLPSERVNNDGMFSWCLKPFLYEEVISLCEITSSEIERCIIVEFTRAWKADEQCTAFYIIATVVAVESSWAQNAQYFRQELWKADEQCTAFSVESSWAQNAQYFRQESWKAHEQCTAFYITTTFWSTFRYHFVVHF